MADKMEMFDKWYEGFFKTQSKHAVFDTKDLVLEAFIAGWIACGSEPANTVEAPKIQHVLSRDQRDTLVAVNMFLVLDQAKHQFGSTAHERLQRLVNVISDMLYDA